MTVVLAVACGPAGSTETSGSGPDGTSSAESTDEAGSSSGSAPECVVDEDCLAGLYCQGGTCYEPECSAPPGEIDFRCPGAECYVDSDCYEGEMCDVPFCVPIPDPACPNAPTFGEIPMSLAFDGDGPIGPLAFAELLPTEGPEVFAIRGPLVVASSESTSATLATATGPLAAVTVGDIDGDGLPDLVTSETGPDPIVQVWIGGPAGFDPQPPIPTMPTSALEAGDRDGDGFDDVTFLSADGLWTMAGSGSGTLGEPVALVEAGVEHFLVTNFDGDDLVDVAYAGDGVHAILSVDGMPLALPGQAPSAAVALVAGDFDDDQLLDFGLVAPDASTVAIWRGPIGMNESVLAAIEGVPTTAAARDVDGDSHSDLVVAVADGSLQVSYGSSSGEGLFACTKEVTAGGTITSIALGDVDGDGDVDIVVSDGASVTMLRQSN